VFCRSLFVFFPPLAIIVLSCFWFTIWYHQIFLILFPTTVCDGIEIWYRCLRLSCIVCSRIGGVMVNVLPAIVVDRVFEPRSGQVKDYKSGICCFSAKHTPLRSKKAKTGWLGIRIMCPSAELWLPTDCCFSELAL
jgi:hypothetical protein